MKKIFTLLFATAMLSTAFAQYGQKGQKDQGKNNDVYVSNNNYGNDRHDNDKFGGYIFTSREKDMQIAQINRDYDYKIESVKRQFFMNPFQKARQIKSLQSQRDCEISQVMQKFNNQKNQFGDYGKNDSWNKKRW
jgi:hypothetical protein